MFKWPTMGDDVMVHPPVMRITVIPVGAGAKDAKRVAVEPIAQKLLDLNKSRVIQWALSQRLNAKLAGLPSVITSTQFPGVKLSYVKISGQETLEVTLYPEIPVETREEGRCLLILHDGNKITAVMMDRLVEEGNWVAAHAATLKQSTWGSELVKVSQYKFDTQMGTILFSPIKVDGGVISKAEYHHICALRSDLRHFVASSTLAARTPRINGKEGRYFAPNDVFAIERTEQGQRLVREGEGGNGAFPYAVTAEGAYYYAPMSFSYYIGMQIYSTDPFEHHGNTTILSSYATGNTSTLHDITDDFWDALAVPGNTINNRGAMIPSFITPSETLYFPDYNQWEYQDSTDPYPDDNDQTYWGGYTGFGRYVQNEYTTTYARQQWRYDGYLVWVGPDPEDYIRVFVQETDVRDYSGSLPMAVFTQQDGLDVVNVVFTPVEASLQVVFGPGSTNTPQGTVYDQDDQWRTSILDVSYSRTTFTTEGVETRTPAVWDARWNAATRLVSYPPSFSLAPQKYYFFDDFTLRTPFGDFAIDPLEIGTAPPGGQVMARQTAVQFWGRYTPWLHLSNGKQMVQGWELFGERKVFYRSKPDGTPFEVTQKLATVAKTDISNIQAVLIDVPLKRIKEFT